MNKPSVSPEEAISLLKKGNARFVCGKTEGPNRTEKQRIHVAQHGQSPFASIVSCADSRVPLSLLFDRGVGDIFGLRVAGNVCSDELMGSIEYSILHLGVPLVVVLGHSKCGAVTAVVEGEEVDSNLIPLAQKIAPAVDKVKAGNPDLGGKDLLNAAIKENVWFQIETLFRCSHHVRSAVDAGTLEVIGAHYDIEQGDVAWYGKHPEEKDLIR